jgi:hypothetical protein
MVPNEGRQTVVTGGLNKFTDDLSAAILAGISSAHPAFVVTMRIEPLSP